MCLLPNDTGDGDDSANHLQNFPTISTLIRASVAARPATDVSATVNATLDTAPGMFRIDAYYSPGRDNVGPAGGRPHAQSFIGTVQVTLPAAARTLKVNVVLPSIANSLVIGLAATAAAGNTSPIGTCFALINTQFDTVFGDSFD
jgi:hypothetical protein